MVSGRLPHCLRCNHLSIGSTKSRPGDRRENPHRPDNNNQSPLTWHSSSNSTCTASNNNNISSNTNSTRNNNHNDVWATRSLPVRWDLNTWCYRRLIWAVYPTPLPSIPIQCTRTIQMSVTWIRIPAALSSTSEWRSTMTLEMGRLMDKRFLIRPEEEQDEEEREWKGNLTGRCCCQIYCRRCWCWCWCSLILS